MPGGSIPFLHPAARRHPVFAPRGSIPGGCFFGFHSVALAGLITFLLWDSSFLPRLLWESASSRSPGPQPDGQRHLHLSLPLPNVAMSIRPPPPPKNTGETSPFPRPGDPEVAEETRTSQGPLPPLRGRLLQGSGIRSVSPPSLALNNALPASPPIQGSPGGSGSAPDFFCPGFP